MLYGVVLQSGPVPTRCVAVLPQSFNPSSFRLSPVPIDDSHAPSTPRKVSASVASDTPKGHTIRIQCRNSQCKKLVSEKKTRQQKDELKSLCVCETRWKVSRSRSIEVETLKSWEKKIKLPSPFPPPRQPLLAPQAGRPPTSLPSSALSTPPPRWSGELLPSAPSFPLSWRSRHRSRIDLVRGASNAHLQKLFT